MQAMLPDRNALRISLPLQREGILTRGLMETLLLSLILYLLSAIFYGQFLPVHYVLPISQFFE